MTSERAVDVDRIRVSQAYGQWLGSAIEADSHCSFLKWLNTDHEVTLSRCPDIRPGGYMLHVKGTHGFDQDVMIINCEDDLRSLLGNIQDHDQVKEIISDLNGGAKAVLRSSTKVS